MDALRAAAGKVYQGMAPMTFKEALNYISTPERRTVIRCELHRLHTLVANHDATANEDNFKADERKKFIQAEIDYIVSVVMDGDKPEFDSVDSRRAFATLFRATAITSLEPGALIAGTKTDIIEPNSNTTPLCTMYKPNDGYCLVHKHTEQKVMRLEDSGKQLGNKKKQPQSPEPEIVQYTTITTTFQHEMTPPPYQQPWQGFNPCATTPPQVYNGSYTYPAPPNPFPAYQAQQPAYQPPSQPFYQQKAAPELNPYTTNPYDTNPYPAPTPYLNTYPQHNPESTQWLRQAPAPQPYHPPHQQPYQPTREPAFTQTAPQNPAPKASPPPSNWGNTPNRTVTPPYLQTSTPASQPTTPHPSKPNDPFAPHDSLAFLLETRNNQPATSAPQLTPAPQIVVTPAAAPTRSTTEAWTASQPTTPHPSKPNDPFAPHNSLAFLLETRNNQPAASAPQLTPAPQIVVTPAAAPTRRATEAESEDAVRRAMGKAYNSNYGVGWVENLTQFLHAGGKINEPITIPKGYHIVMPAKELTLPPNIYVDGAYHYYAGILSFYSGTLVIKSADAIGKKLSPEASVILNHGSKATPERNIIEFQGK